jgi:hypothetical protein
MASASGGFVCHHLGDGGGDGEHPSNALSYSYLKLKVSYESWKYHRFDRAIWFAPAILLERGHRVIVIFVVGLGNRSHAFGQQCTGDMGFRRRSAAAVGPKIGPVARRSSRLGKIVGEAQGGSGLPAGDGPED